MPPPERTARYQTALLWEVNGFNDQGQPARSEDPVELRVRWNNTQSRMLSPNGQPITVDATAVVDVDIALGSVMWEGSLADLPANYYLMQVASVATVKDIKGRAIQRTVGLKYLAESLPSS